MVPAEVGEPTPGRLWTYRQTTWLPRRVDARTDERLAAGVARAVRSLGMEHPPLWINDSGAVELALGRLDGAAAG